MSQADDLILALQGKGGLAPDAKARLLGAFWDAYHDQHAPGVPTEKADETDMEKVLVLATHRFVTDILNAHDPDRKAIREQAAADEAALPPVDLGEPPKPQPKPLAAPGEVK